jgi:hypothetical protein
MSSIEKLKKTTVDRSTTVLSGYAQLRLPEGTTFAVDVYATANGGFMHYSRREENGTEDFIADVVCTHVFEGGKQIQLAAKVSILIAGPNPVEESYVGLAICRDGGGPGVDSVRIPGFNSEADARAYCDPGRLDSFHPAIVVRGMFNF